MATRTRTPTWIGPVLVVATLTLITSCDACFGPPDDTIPTTSRPRPEQCPDDGCLRNIDCSAGAICMKDDGAGIDDAGCCLQLLCATDADCSGDELCVPNVGICQVPAVCVPGGSGCASGEQCIGAGDTPVCVDASTLEIASSCHLDPPRVVVSPLGSARFRVLGFDDVGEPVYTTTASFASDVGSVASFMRSGTLTASPCDEPPCRGTVTAQTGGASCTADVVVLGPLAPNTVRVSVADLASRAPLVDVEVVVRRTGATGLDIAVTDADGIVVIDDLPSSAVEAISVFPDSHGWQTVIDPGAADVALFVEQVEKATISIVSGAVDVSAAPSQGDIALGYVGFAPRVPFFDVDFRRYFGPLLYTSLEIEGVTDGPQDIYLPSGQTFRLGNTPIKPRFVAVARPFENTLFALGGKIRLADVGPFIFADIGTGSPNDGFHVERFVTHAMRLFAQQTVLGVAPTTIDAPDALTALAFDDATLALSDITLLPQMPNHFLVDVDVPLLPCHAPLTVNCASESRKRGALVVTSARVPGRGLVPLGMHTLLDDDNDSGNFDGRVGDVVGSNGIVNAGIGRAKLYSKAPHSGLEGQEVTFAVVARNDGVLFAEQDAPLSVLVQTTATLPASVGFSSEGFLPTPTGVLGDDGVVTTQVSPAVRSELVRVRLSGNDGAMWDILMPSARPLVLADLRPDDVTGRDTRGHVVNVRFTGSPDAPPTYQSLVERTGRDLDRTDDFVQAWARAPLDR